MTTNTAQVIKRGREMLELYRCVYKEPIIDRISLLNFSGFYTWAGITGKLKNFNEKLENDEDRLDFIRDIEIGLRIYYETDITLILKNNYDLALSFPYTPWSLLGMLTRDHIQCQVFGRPVENIEDGWIKFEIHDRTDTDGYNNAIFKIKQNYSELFKDYMK